MPRVNLFLIWESRLMHRVTSSHPKLTKILKNFLFLLLTKTILRSHRPRNVDYKESWRLFFKFQERLNKTFMYNNCVLTKIFDSTLYTISKVICLISTCSFPCADIYDFYGVWTRQCRSTASIEGFFSSHRFLNYLLSTLLIRS